MDVDYIMINLLLGGPPLIIYFFWCRLAISYLECKKNKNTLCISLGILRFILGLALGPCFLWLKLSRIGGLDHLWFPLLLSPVAAIEWGVISFFIGKVIKKNNCKKHKYNIKSILLWIIGGTVISVMLSTLFMLLWSCQ